MKAKTRQDLGWATKRLRKGYKLVRMTWVNDGFHIVMHEFSCGSLGIMFVNKRGQESIWMPDPEDLLANDYAIWHVSMLKGKRKKMTRVTSS